MKKYSFELDNNKIDLLELYVPNWKEHMQNTLNKELKNLEEKKVPKDVREYFDKIKNQKTKDKLEKSSKKEKSNLKTVETANDNGIKKEPFKRL